MILGLLFFSFSSWALTFSRPALDPAWDQVVLIRTEARDLDNADVPSYCNATLLSDSVLVTAAHCLHHAEVLKDSQIQIELGYYKYVQRPDGRTVRVGYVSRSRFKTQARFFFPIQVKRAFDSKGFKARIGPNEDIAVVLLDHPILEVEVDSLMKVISKGEMTEVQKKIQHYKPSVVSINFMEEMSTDTKRMADIEDLSWGMGSHFKSKSRSRVQAGDSGAPLTLQLPHSGNQRRLVGVVKGRAETWFSNWDVFTATQGNLCGISNQMPQEHKSTLCW